VQGNRRLEQSWVVPFKAESGVRGRFSLHWNQELQRYLAGRIGATAGRPEYLGAVLRATAGRWASWQTLRAATPVRLQPTGPETAGAEAGVPGGRSSAAMIIDSFVLELVFELEAPEA
jgi:hypothetical protein